MAPAPERPVRVPHEHGAACGSGVAAPRRLGPPGPRMRCGPAQGPAQPRRAPGRSGALFVWRRFSRLTLVEQGELEAEGRPVIGRIVVERRALDTAPAGVPGWGAADVLHRRPRCAGVGERRICPRSVVPAALLQRREQRDHRGAVHAAAAHGWGTTAERPPGRQRSAPCLRALNAATGGSAMLGPRVPAVAGNDNRDRGARRRAGAARRADGRQCAGHRSR